MWTTMAVRSVVSIGVMGTLRSVKGWRLSGAIVAYALVRRSDRFHTAAEPALPSAPAVCLRRGVEADEELDEVRSGQRAAEQVALDLVAAEIAQQCQLLLGLHPLGDEAAGHGVTHVDDGTHDLRIVRAGGEVGDQG